jgi:threonyl-tRNA synthetase
MKIPWILVVGPRDAESNNVSVRMRGIMDDLGAVGLEKFADAISEEINTRGDSSALKTCFPEVKIPEDA